MRENRDHPMNKRLHLRLLMGFVLLGLCSGCNRPDAPWCLMSAGEWMEDTLIWEPSSDFALVVENHLEVECSIGDSNQVQLIWSGPANLVAHASALRSGNELVLSHEDRCQWTRDLSHIVRAKVSAPAFDAVHLNGQGSFNLVQNDLAQSFEVDAQDYAGTIDLHLTADSATVKLHNGAAQATVTGNVQTLLGYSSGLSSLDASECASGQAFIHQSGVSDLRFKALEYAYVRIDAPGDALGGPQPPLNWQLNRTGSGELRWQH